MQGLDQQLPAPRIIDEIVLQVRITLHDPDVAEHFVQHARRASGAPLAAQLVEDVPGRGTEQTQDDLAIGKRGVVVWNFAQAHGKRDSDTSDGGHAGDTSKNSRACVTCVTCVTSVTLSL